MHCCTKPYHIWLLSCQAQLADSVPLCRKRETLVSRQIWFSCDLALGMIPQRTDRCIWTGSGWYQLLWGTIVQWRTTKGQKDLLIRKRFMRNVLEVQFFITICGQIIWKRKGFFHRRLQFALSHIITRLLENHTNEVQNDDSSTKAPVHLYKPT